jgi:hypothetical protein
MDAEPTLQSGQVVWRNGHRKMLDAITVHGNVLRACRETGVVRQTFYQWQDKDPTYKQAVAEAVEAGGRGFCDAAIDHIYKAIEEDERVTPESVRIATKVLASFRPERWADKSKTELTGPNGGELVVTLKLQGGDGDDTA